MYRFTRYDLRSTIWGLDLGIYEVRFGDMKIWECGNVKIYEVRFTKYDLGFGSWNFDLRI